MPFEIKTGRAVMGMEHRAQTMLYTLLVSERYGVSVKEGLLFYTQNDEVVRVPRGWNEIRGLIGGRNDMAAYMMRRARNNDGKQSKDPATNIEESEERFLPPTIDDERACKRCYALDTCMLYRKVPKTYFIF
jgi:DNA replication ATP-dependent helicase Dna2